MKIFIINLQHDTEKKEHMKTLCEKHSLSYEFIKAVDGLKLREDELLEIYSKERAIKKLGRELTKGEIGCALSHKRIFEKIINENIEYALILEDDIQFSQDLLEILNIIEKFPQNWELVLLGHHTGSSRKIDTRYSIWYKKFLHEKAILRRPCETGYGCYGYCITKNGAKKLLNHLNSIELPIDHYAGSDKYVNLYIIQQSIIMIDNRLLEKSNIHDDRKKMEITYTDTEKSFKRKLFEVLGIYTVLVNIREKMKIGLCKIKFLREYK